MTDRHLHRRVAAVCFWLYAVALTVATHIPRVDPDLLTLVGRLSPLQVDKTLHLVAYGIFGALAGTAFAGGRPVAGIIRLFVTLACWAFVDEISQPLFGRSADVWDWCFDVAGLAIGLACVGAWRRWRGAEITRTAS